MSSSGFVFGENLAERVQFCKDEIGKSSEDNGVASPDSTDQSDVVSNGGNVLSLSLLQFDLKCSKDKSCI